jgi:hypothetical protein
MNQRVVSLGGNCMVALEVRKFFGIEAANLFDWWITPGDALVLLIEKDFEGLFLRENLKIVGEGQSVANTRYGILHHHDFFRNDDTRRVEEIREPEIVGNVNKLAYLKKRWDDLACNPDPVLFVRWGWEINEPLLAGIPAEPSGADAVRLIAALDRKFPQLDYRILLIDAPEVALEHPKILYRDSGDFTEPGQCLDAADLAWKDNTPIFSRVFSSVTSQ